MFSGIVEEVGSIIEIAENADGARIKIKAAADGIMADAKMGESIAVMGCCLTVVDFGKNWFSVDAVIETLRRTKLGELKPGAKVNLEKALKVSDRLGGHIVTGHIDTVGTIQSIEQEGFSYVVTCAAEPKWSPFFVEKGSVTIDGVSLTVADCSPEVMGDAFWFKVALIPHTWQVTTLNELAAGSRVNLETDIIARYVARMTNSQFLATVS